MLEKTYLPFEISKLENHFTNIKHLEKFKKTVERYVDFINNYPDRNSISIDKMRTPCQIEKDETVWTASCFTQLYNSTNFKNELVVLLTKAFGEVPPLKNFKNWTECIEPEVKIYFEPNLPSPKVYKEYIKNKIETLLIPYVKHSAFNKINLEGATNVDAIIINPHNGFAVLFEAKVLSDLSYQVTYDENRNQMIRNIDVMIEKNDKLIDDLNKREPENSLFALLTPRKFKDITSFSRLYAYKFNEYKNNPLKIKEDLPHRINIDYSDLSKRIGWLTWEDFKELSNNYCKWL